MSLPALVTHTQIVLAAAATAIPVLVALGAFGHALVALGFPRVGAAVEAVGVDAVKFLNAIKAFLPPSKP